MIASSMSARCATNVASSLVYPALPIFCLRAYSGTNPGFATSTITKPSLRAALPPVPPAHCASKRIRLAQTNWPSSSDRFGGVRGPAPDG
jgi:hypothetical protein